LDDVERLTTVLKPVYENQDANAAVALLLRKTGRDLEVLFVKRAEIAYDPWSGQMALPGGKRNVKDLNLKQTVVRETLEETSINLLSRCRFLGTMEPQRPRLRPEMRILPFVVLLRQKPFIQLNAELEDFSWILLKELVQRKGVVNFSFGKVPAYIIGEIVIWGLTYRILEDFIHILG